MPRLVPLRDPVTLTLDGEPIAAERAEPAVLALVAAGRIALARSPKFHRPRGPRCLRAACDGCLARVDGEPNVMTCRVPAAEGMRVETQNVVGSRRTDLLRVADWFFPEGMNHHELLAGVPGLQRVMQAFARRVAGLGRLPDEAVASRPARRRRVDALVVGAGAAGMSAALGLLARGRSVEVVDDDLTWGGGIRALLDPPCSKAKPLELARSSAPYPALQDPRWQPLLRSFEAALDRRPGGLTLHLRTTAGAVYGADVLVASEAAGVEILEPRTLVLAPGAHDGALAFPGNDLPGIVSARALAWMLAGGVAPGERIVLVHAGLPSAFAHAVGRSLAGVTTVQGTPEAAAGGGRIKEVTVAVGSRTTRLACDTLVIDAAPSPAYELCVQAGASVTHETRGFAVVVPRGRIRDGVFALGEVTGEPLDPDVIARQTAEIVAQV